MLLTWRSTVRSLIPRSSAISRFVVRPRAAAGPRPRAADRPAGDAAAPRRRSNRAWRGPDAAPSACEAPRGPPRARSPAVVRVAERRGRPGRSGHRTRADLVWRVEPLPRSRPPGGAAARASSRVACREPDGAVGPIGDRGQEQAHRPRRRASTSSLGSARSERDVAGGEGDLDERLRGAAAAWPGRRVSSSGPPDHRQPRRPPSPWASRSRARPAPAGGPSGWPRDRRARPRRTRPRSRCSSACW